MRRPKSSPIAAAVPLLVLATAGTPKAREGHLDVPPAAVAERSPAYSIANSSEDQILSEIARRKLPVERVPHDVPGVRTPVRLVGPLHGVTIHSSLPKEERATTPFEILDARLALALDDLCAILANHDVVELVHFTMYRPNDAPSAEPSGGLSRHPGGLAIDAGLFRKRNGSALTVEFDWPAAVGATTCGPRARRVLGRKGRELISIVCEAADERLFHVILTPHFNRAHRDHVHLEIKEGVKWFLVH